MLLKLETHDPSGSGYIGTLLLKQHHTHDGESPSHPEVTCLAVEITGFYVWQKRGTETAYLPPDQAAKLRDALTGYLSRAAAEAKS